MFFCKVFLTDEEFYYMNLLEMNKGTMFLIAVQKGELLTWKLLPTHLCIGLCILRDPRQAGALRESWRVVVHIFNLYGGGSCPRHPSPISGLHHQEVGLDLLPVQTTHGHGDGPCGGVDGEHFREGRNVSHLDASGV